MKEAVTDRIEEAFNNQVAATPLAEDLKQRLAKLEEMAHNEHSIAPEVIEAIMQQAAKRAVQQVAAHLRKVADILEALEK